MPEVSPSGAGSGLAFSNWISGQESCGRRAAGSVSRNKRQVLTTLLERPGDLVTREELRQL